MYRIAQAGGQVKIEKGRCVTIQPALCVLRHPLLRPSRPWYIPCVGTLPLCQKRSGTRIAQDAIQGPAFLEGPCREYTMAGRALEGMPQDTKGRLYENLILTYLPHLFIIALTDSDKSVDEEEYMFFRMNREEMAGENLREGNMEVAFELWIERRSNRRPYAGCGSK